jgi:hypothetical protein
MITMQIDITSPCVGDALSSSMYNANGVIFQVSQEAFLQAAKNVRKQITPAVIAQYERWRDGNGFH